MHRLVAGRAAGLRRGRVPRQNQALDLPLPLSFHIDAIKGKIAQEKRKQEWWNRAGAYRALEMEQIEHQQLGTAIALLYWRDREKFCCSTEIGPWEIGRRRLDQSETQGRQKKLEHGNFELLVLLHQDAEPLGCGTPARRECRGEAVDDAEKKDGGVGLSVPVCGLRISDTKHCKPRENQTCMVRGGKMSGFKR